MELNQIANNGTLKKALDPIIRFILYVEIILKNSNKQLVTVQRLTYSLIMWHVLLLASQLHKIAGLKLTLSSLIFSSAFIAYPVQGSPVPVLFQANLDMLEEIFHFLNIEFNALTASYNKKNTFCKCMQHFNAMMIIINHICIYRAKT